MARPSKLTPESRAKLVEATRLGMTRKLAAAYAGIAVGTFYRWMETGATAPRGQFKELRDAIKQAEAQGAARALVKVHAAADDSWQAAAWLLERRHGYRRGGPAEAELEAEGLVLELDEAAELRRTLTQIKSAIGRAIASGSWQAVFAGQRLALQTWRELAAVSRADGEEPDQLSGEAFERELVLELAEWPDQYLEHAIRTYEERHGLRLLGVLEGGRSG